MNKTNVLPILYSLRNCPYAMRARMAIFRAKQTILLRDLVLSNKPAEMLIASPKGTVPTLVLPNGDVVDESVDVMLWALNETDPDDLLHCGITKINHQSDGEVDSESQNDSESKVGNKAASALTEILALIYEFDHGFKPCLEQYKCAKRYRENNIVQCRTACQQYIARLEQRLTGQQFLISDKESLADIAVLPFIRQFARVERQWYLKAPYPHVQKWLNNYLQSKMFSKVMAKYPLWEDCHEDILFG